METSDIIFYIILIIIILIIIYIFWKKNQNRPLLNNTQYVPMTPHDQSSITSSQPVIPSAPKQSLITSSSPVIPLAPNQTLITPTSSVPVIPLAPSQISMTSHPFISSASGQTLITPPSQNQTTIMNTLYNTLQQGIIQFHQQILELRQKLAPLSGKSLTDNLKIGLKHLVNNLNQKIISLNNQLPVLEEKLTETQDIKLNQLLNTFNQEIKSFNELLYPLIGEDIMSIKIPYTSDIPASPSTPAQPAYHPFLPLDCDSYKSAEGAYCIGQPYQDESDNVQLCYQIGTDPSNSTKWFATVGNILCDSTDPDCQTVIDTCHGKPTCKFVGSFCNLGDLNF